MFFKGWLEQRHTHNRSRKGRTSGRNRACSDGWVRGKLYSAVSQQQALRSRRAVLGQMLSKLAWYQGIHLAWTGFNLRSL